MMMQDREEQDREDDLDRLLAVARAAGPQPGADLIARILTDAATAQPIAPRRAPLAAPRRTRLAWLASVFGGGGALAGISLAMVAGVFVGVVQPAPVAALASVFIVDATMDSVDLLPLDSALWGED